MTAHCSLFTQQSATGGDDNDAGATYFSFHEFTVHKLIHRLSLHHRWSLLVLLPNKTKSTTLFKQFYSVNDVCCIEGRTWNWFLPYVSRTNANGQLLCWCVGVSFLSTFCTSALGLGSVYLALDPRSGPAAAVFRWVISSKLPFAVLPLFRKFEK